MANIKRVFSILNNRNSTNKASLIAALFTGLPVKEVSNTFNINPATVKLSLTKGRDFSFLDDPLFSQRYPHNVTRSKISSEECDTTLDLFKRVLAQKSGNYNAIFYYTDEKSTLYKKYCAMYSEICQTYHTKTGKTLKLEPRCERVFLYQMLSLLRLHKISQPKSCQWCANGETFKKEHKKATVELSLLTSMGDNVDPQQKEELLLKLNYFKRKVSHLDLHKQRLKFQRDYIKNVSQGMDSRTAVIYYDFVSWYRGNGKVNCLVFALERRINGAFERWYYDYPCEDDLTNNHDHYFYAAAMRHFFFESGAVYSPSQGALVDTIYFSGDNGSPFLTKFSCFTESYVQHLTGIKLFIVPLCPHHAYNMCDSHGGHIKPRLKKLITQGKYPDRDKDLKAELEHHLKRTLVFPLRSINRRDIDTQWYGKFGGVNSIRSILAISKIGWIEHMASSDKMTVGIMRTRRLAGQPDTYSAPREYRLPNDVPAPTYGFVDIRGWISKVSFI